MNLKCLILSISTLLLLGSCSDEDENSPPTVQIQTPSTSDTFSVGDIISINAKLTDDVELKSVNVFLRKDRNIVLTGPSQSVTGNNITAKLFFQISDTLLKSGNYSLEVSANDGEKTASAYVDIGILGIAEKEISYIVATSNGSNSSLYEIINGQQQFISNLGFEVKLMEVDHRRQLLWLVSMSSAKIVLYDLKSKQIIGEKSFPGKPQTYFTNVFYADPFTYIGTNEGEILKFTNSINGSLIYNSNSNAAIEAISVIGNKLIFEENYNGNSPSKITSILASGGNPIFRTDFNGELLSIGKSGDEEVVFSAVNRTGDFEFYTIDLETGIRTFKYNSSANFSLGQSFDLYEHVIADSFQIYKFQYPQNILSSMKMFQNRIQIIELSQLKNEFAIATDNKFFLLNYSNATVLSSMSFNQPIKSIAVRNNI